jgi:hypothetical protein
MRWLQAYSKRRKQCTHQNDGHRRALENTTPHGRSLPQNRFRVVMHITIQRRQWRDGNVYMKRKRSANSKVGKIVLRRSQQRSAIEPQISLHKLTLGWFWVGPGETASIQMVWKSFRIHNLIWLRGLDLNQRPLGYENRK